MCDFVNCRLISNDKFFIKPLIVNKLVSRYHVPYIYKAVNWFWFKIQNFLVEHIVALRSCALIKLRINKIRVKILLILAFIFINSDYKFLFYSSYVVFTFGQFQIFLTNFNWMVKLILKIFIRWCFYNSFKITRLENQNALDLSNWV